MSVGRRRHRPAPFEARVRASLEEHPEFAGNGARRAGWLDGLDHVVP